jgi:histidinol-phosphate aminotransferase
MQASRANNAAGLKVFVQAFTQMGLAYVPSAANFILVRVGEGQKVFNALQGLGVIVRPMGGYQLPEWIRISIGTPAENSRCLAGLRKVLGA